MAIPIRLLWNLQISRIEKISIALAMCVGVITMVCAIVRASSLGVFADAGQIPIPWLALWATIEGFVGTLIYWSVYLYLFLSSPPPYSVGKSDQLTNTYSTAIIVNCLPAFAIFIRRKVVSSRIGTNGNAEAYTQNSLASKPKSRVRSESVLLDDVGPVEAGRRSASSHEGSESWTQRWKWELHVQWYRAEEQG